MTQVYVYQENQLENSQEKKECTKLDSQVHQKVRDTKFYLCLSTKTTVTQCDLSGKNISVLLNY
jgi:hypothetical protein